MNTEETKAPAPAAAPATKPAGAPAGAPSSTQQRGPGGNNNRFGGPGGNNNRFGGQGGNNRFGQGGPGRSGPGGPGGNRFGGPGRSGPGSPAGSAPAGSAPAGPGGNRFGGPGGPGGNRFGGPGGPGGNRFGGPGGPGGNRFGGPGGPGGNRFGGRGPRRDGRRNDAPLDDGPQLLEKVVFINRCAKVVKGGRRFSFSALIVVGDQKGKVGYGFGKANEVSEAIRKGTDAAKKGMQSVVVVNGTIPHEIYSVYGGGKIILKPAAPGTGLIAGNTVRAVLEAAGVNNIISKSLGSANHANVVKATMKAMLSMRTADQVLSARGKKKKETTI